MNFILKKIQPCDKIKGNKRINADHQMEVLLVAKKRALYQKQICHKQPNFTFVVGHTASTVC